MIGLISAILSVSIARLAHLLAAVLFRALLGIGVGAERPAGAALSMETWPVRLCSLRTSLYLPRYSPPS